MAPQHPSIAAAAATITTTIVHDSIEDETSVEDDGDDEPYDGQSPLNC